MGHHFTLPTNGKHISAIYIIAGLEEGIQSIQEDRKKEEQRNIIAIDTVTYKYARTNYASIEC